MLELLMIWNCYGESSNYHLQEKTCLRCNFIRNAKLFVRGRQQEEDSRICHAHKPLSHLGTPHKEPHCGENAALFTSPLNTETAY